MDCPLCGPDKLLLQFVTTQKRDKVFCEQWETEVVEKKSKKVLTKKEYLVKDLIKELSQDLKNYPQHIFTATWQYQQFNTMRNCVGDDEVVMVYHYEFAENYRSAYQDEPQSAHWNYTQITSHPVVCYYRCSCNEVVTHSVVVVSDDLQHDCYAVDSMIRRVHTFLKVRGLHFARSIEWSDGCSSQYKSKGPFFLLQQRGSEGQEIWKHFFGSRHGKNPSDGESAVVKSSITRAVKCRRATITNAESFFDFANRNLEKDDSENGCQHFKPSFLFLKSADITRKPMPKIKPLTGTRSIHAIISNNGRKLKYRNLSCTCQGCLKEEACTETYTGPWKL